MIVGNGLLAHGLQSRFPRRNDLILFASGVSNSGEIRQSAFAREAALFRSVVELNPGRTPIYFSSCAYRDEDTHVTPYIRHKRQMEACVANAGGFTFRLPQIAGHSGNPGTLLNFLLRKIQNDETVPVWTMAERNVIDIEDMTFLLERLLEELGTHPPPAPVDVASLLTLRMPDLVTRFAHALGAEPRMQPVTRGSSLDVNLSSVERIARQSGLALDGDYLERTVNKYYG